MRIVIVVAAIAALVIPGVPAVATSDPGGVSCGFSWGLEPGGPPDEQLVIIQGGPLVVAELPRGDWPRTEPTDPGWDALANPVSATLTCSMRSGSTYASPAFASVSGSGTGVVIIPPTAATYISSYPGYPCAEVELTDAHGTVTHLYFDDRAREFTTDPSVPCYVERSLEDPIDERVTCPVLEEAFPPEGDVIAPDPVGKLWDCRPYDPA
ncbi:MAG: hypothetical protein QOE45_534 [Frankiaceae bacterium]|nr:hypothetical protein [Frankiaceae bacterium]